LARVGIIGESASCLLCRRRHNRHTFASRALENSPDEQSRITKHMLALSTYLGHAHISDTYWYLQSTTHLMTDIADDCQAYLEGEQL
jgi:integrase/recombinase XerD